MDNTKYSYWEILKLRGFFIHLLVFILVNIGLVIINFTTSTAYLWFIHPLYGWGIGVVAHGWATPKLRKVIFG